MNLREDLEERVRKRGVRVEARLALLRLLLDHDAESSGSATAGGLDDRRADLLDAVRQAAREVQGALS